MDTKQELIKIYKEEVVDSKAGILLDSFMNATPGLNVAWGTMKGAIEQSKDMRYLRGLELLELFADPGFQELFLCSEQALDGFGLCYEAIVKERNGKKRKIIKNILLGFTELSEEDQEAFELEKILSVSGLLSVEELIFIENIDSFAIPRHYRRLRKVNEPTPPISNYFKGDNGFFDNILDDDYLNITNGLESVNILIGKQEAALPVGGPGFMPKVYFLSKFGEKFIKYYKINES